MTYFAWLSLILVIYALICSAELARLHWDAHKPRDKVLAIITLGISAVILAGLAGEPQSLGDLCILTIMAVLNILIRIVELVILDRHKSSHSRNLLVKFAITSLVYFAVIQIKNITTMDNPRRGILRLRRWLTNERVQAELPRPFAGEGYVLGLI